MILSAVVITKNRQKQLAECIKKLKFCGEIIVLDDNSTDQTASVAAKLGARVYTRSLDNNFAAQRNFGMEKAKGNWVLFVDDDERVTDVLAKEIIKITSDPTQIYDGINIKRRDVIWGHVLKHGEGGDIRLLRLAKKNSGRWIRRIHEVWNVEGNLYTLKNYLFHYPHPTLHEFIDSVNSMSTLHAQANFEEGKNSSILKIIIWPKLKFLNNYIIRFGFLDGIYGFADSMVMSFHSYLAWSKLWLIQKKTKNL